MGMSNKRNILKLGTLVGNVCNGSTGTVTARDGDVYTVRDEYGQLDQYAVGNLYPCLVKS